MVLRSTSSYIYWYFIIALDMGSKIKIDIYMWRALIIQTGVPGASKLMIPCIGNVFNEECPFEYELPGMDPKLGVEPLAARQVRPL